jgi:hypothetical protein
MPGVPANLVLKRAARQCGELAAVFYFVSHKTEMSAARGAGHDRCCGVALPLTGTGAGRRHNCNATHGADAGFDHAEQRGLVGDALAPRDLRDLDCESRMQSRAPCVLGASHVNLKFAT